MARKSELTDGPSLLKMVLVGAPKTGKTCLLKHLGQSSPAALLNAPYQPTVGIEFTSFTRDNIKFQIWDMSGDPKYQSLLTAYMKNAAIVGFFIHQETTDEELAYIENFLKTHTSLDVIKLLFINNAKPDILNQNAKRNFDIVQKLLKPTAPNTLPFNSDTNNPAEILAIENRALQLGGNTPKIKKEDIGFTLTPSERRSRSKINKLRLLAAFTGIGFMYVLGAIAVQRTRNRYNPTGFLTDLKNFYIRKEYIKVRTSADGEQIETPETPQCYESPPMVFNPSGSTKTDIDAIIKQAQNITDAALERTAFSHH